MVLYLVDAMKASRMWSPVDPIPSRSLYETPRQNTINVFTGGGQRSWGTEEGKTSSG